MKDGPPSTKRLGGALSTIPRAQRREAGLPGPTSGRLSELLSEDDDGENFNEAIEESLRVHSAHEHATALRAALCVLTDLARQRWSIRVNEGGDPEVKRSEGDRLDPRHKKARIRAQELVKRDEQLREPAARRFIEGMEKKSVHNGHFVSIYSVIRGRSRTCGVAPRRAPANWR